jgi:hypothetical protein
VLKPAHAPTKELLKRLDSYGDRLETVRFDADGDPCGAQPASSIFAGLGRYYLAVWTTALIAFGVATYLIWPYLGLSNRVFSKDGKVATNPVANVGVRSEKEKSEPHWQTEAFEEWIAGVGKLKAEEQVEAVRNKLIEFNPDFQGEVNKKIERGKVTEFEVHTVHVADISPVRALSSLWKLTCSGYYGNIGILKDLSPLSGLKLKYLDCGYNRVSDLTPLQNMPLEHLTANNLPIAELNGLSGMQLKYLGCWRTRISDLTPLKGMPLTHLYCAYTAVNDLSPIEDANLRLIEIQWTLISDISILKKMKNLKSIRTFHTKIKTADLEELRAALPECKIDNKTP